MLFCERLKMLRKSRKYTMDKLTELYNIKYNAKMNKSTLSKYENGTQAPIYTVVVNLADFFNVSVDYLCGSDKDTININAYTPKTISVIEKLEKLNDMGKEIVDCYIINLIDNPLFINETTQADNTAKVNE